MMTTRVPEYEEEIAAEKAVQLLRERLDESTPYLVTVHTITNGKINHAYTMDKFPTGDLMPCVAYLETEFIKILKRGETGNGRM